MGTLVKKMKKILKKRKGKIRKISVKEISRVLDGKLRKALITVNSFHTVRGLVKRHHTEIPDEMLHELIGEMEKKKDITGKRLINGIHIKKALEKIGYPPRRVNRLLRERGYVIQGEKVLDPHKLLRP